VDVVDASTRGPRRLVIVGRPGAGKGTQCARLAATLGSVHVSTGDLFREAVRIGTPMGRMVGATLSAGDLVSDELVVGVVAERLGRADVRARGFLLDGFPRSVAQAQAFDELLGDDDIDLVVELAVPADVVRGRLETRWICAACGHIDGIVQEEDPDCVACGGAMLRRDDDAGTAVRRRLAEYDAETAPMLEWYLDRGQLVVVDGAGDPDEVSAALLGAMGSWWSQGART